MKYLTFVILACGASICLLTAQKVMSSASAIKIDESNNFYVKVSSYAAAEGGEIAASYDFGIFKGYDENGSGKFGDVFARIKTYSKMNVEWTVKDGWIIVSHNGCKYSQYIKVPN